MKKNFLIRAFLGVTIVSLGGILLLRNLGVITFNSWPLFWGAFWAFAGLLILLFSYRRPIDWVWGLLLIAVGVLIGLSAYGVINIGTWKSFWPVILIAIGLSVVFGIGSGRRQPKKRVTDDGDSEKVAIFYGEES